MRVSNLNTIFFFLLFFAAGVVAFFVLEPFLSAILVAAVLATFFFKPYKFFCKIFGGKDGIGASFTLLLVAFFVIIPTVIVSMFVLSEATRIFENFSEGKTSFSEIAENIESSLVSLPRVGKYFGEQVQLEKFFQNIAGSSGQVFSLLEAIYGSVAGFLFWIFALFFTLFYFLIDGERAIRFLKRISPLADSEDDELMRDFVSMSRATIKGSIIVGVVQGLFGGIAFAIVGLSSPVIWGTVMGIFSLVPFIGTGIVWFPAGFWLLFSGEIWQGIFLLSFGVGVVSMVDNILRPKLVGNDTQVHPLFVFFSTLGGLSVFGISGILIGPIVVSFFLALVRIYSREFKGDLDIYNKGQLS